MSKRAKPLDRASQRGKVGKKVRAARKARSLTQEDFARDVGVSVSWLAQLERGTDLWPGKQVRHFRAEAGKLIRIAEALHPLLNPAELLEAWNHDPDMAADVAAWLEAEQDRRAELQLEVNNTEYRVRVVASRQQELERIYGMSEESARRVDAMIQVYMRWEDE